MADNAQPHPSVEGLFVAGHEGYWELRLQPTHSFPRIMEQMEEVRNFCADKKPNRMLLDLRGILGEFTVTDRYELGNFGGRLQGLLGRVAVIAQAALIDPQKFGVKVAQNRGLSVDIFHDSDAALRWLLRP